eukprot:CAMPEP_0202881368 /NCGR_PEP_ID=MMETSP1391-20130828/36426_1 /ASSEMBLY_ACC=CAM_ASM_000867 /TAXON_ID=1034604 /ORGANISM="Chlamydomonas leiostraca, Strain SAG 11-49" /LENGTH=156 /DNA_ID=CAMNT_0049564041 /DNA_START=145 /DNA_END=613 /DNA_ORIENTATION=+
MQWPPNPRKQAWRPNPTMVGHHDRMHPRPADMMATDIADMAGGSRVPRLQVYCSIDLAACLTRGNCAVRSALVLIQQQVGDALADWELAPRLRAHQRPLQQRHLQQRVVEALQEAVILQHLLARCLWQPFPAPKALRSLKKSWPLNAWENMPKEIW